MLTTESYTPLEGEIRGRILDGALSLIEGAKKFGCCSLTYRARQRYIVVLSALNGNVGGGRRSLCSLPGQGSVTPLQFQQFVVLTLGPIITGLALC